MLATKTRFVRRDTALFRASSRHILKPPSDPAICSRCNVVWRRGTWTLDPSLRREVCRWATPASVICPACRLTAERNPIGILYLGGAFLRTNRGEILQLLRNAERVAAIKNPLERVMRTQAPSPDDLVVEATSGKLARRLGRAVSRAYGGTLRIRFSHQDRLVRVYWRRDSARSAA